MEAQGRPDSYIRTIGTQPTRRHSSQPLAICDPRSRFLSGRLRRVVCDHLGSTESQALGLATLCGRGAQQVSANIAHPRSHGQSEPSPQDEPSGQSAVRLWSPIGTQISAPPSWSQCGAKCRIRLKGFWLMAKEIGLVAECLDVQLDTAEAECPR